MSSPDRSTRGERTFACFLLEPLRFCVGVGVRAGEERIGDSCVVPGSHLFLLFVGLLDNGQLRVGIRHRQIRVGRVARAVQHQRPLLQKAPVDGAADEADLHKQAARELGHHVQGQGGGKWVFNPSSLPLSDWHNWGFSSTYILL